MRLCSNRGVPDSWASDLILGLCVGVIVKLRLHDNRHLLLGQHEVLCNSSHHFKVFVNGVELRALHVKDALANITQALNRKIPTAILNLEREVVSWKGVFLCLVAILTSVS